MHLFDICFCIFFLEKKIDIKYWGNPQVYINKGCSLDLPGPHFTLFNFKVKDLLSFNIKPRKLTVLGELRYEVGNSAVTLNCLKR